MLTLPISSVQLFRRCFIADIAEAAKIKGILTRLKPHTLLKAMKYNIMNSCLEIGILAQDLVMDRAKLNEIGIFAQRKVDR